MKVSVWMTAYNHEKYICQCLDSVLMQKTNFEFEIILGEDFSSDNTRDIVINYKNKYPEKFKLYLPDKNIGMMKMDMATKQLCSGDYIALLNGDDYWTDDNKLQLQADLLDKDSDAIMCFHKASLINEETGENFESYFGEETNELPIESLLNGYNPIMTPTVMVRNCFELESWYEELPYGDMPLYLMLAQKGKIMYIDKNMSVYRIHSSGNWQGESAYNNLLKDLDFYKFINEKLDYKFDKKIDDIFAQRYYELIKVCIMADKTDESKKFFELLETGYKDFFNKNADDMKTFSEIIYNGIYKNNHSELLSKPIKWKVN
ncbi:MAG: hypothetical protein HGGPFJEG_00945 [Ignavibacteria bacterium]|nr:hypothetical protein [Ignavibacteria bacterium]